MIEVTLTILFIIGIFGVLRSNRDEEEENTQKPESGKKSLWWHLWNDDFGGTTYPGYHSHSE